MRSDAPLVRAAREDDLPALTEIYAHHVLHEKFGFERVGLLPAVGWKFDRWVDSVLMQRALGGGAGDRPEEHH